MPACSQVSLEGKSIFVLLNAAIFIDHFQDYESRKLVIRTTMKIVVW